MPTMTYCATIRVSPVVSGATGPPSARALVGHTAGVKSGLSGAMIRSEVAFALGVASAEACRLPDDYDFSWKRDHS
jgi:hypothetical protein